MVEYAGGRDAWHQSSNLPSERRRRILIPIRIPFHPWWERVAAAVVAAAVVAAVAAAADVL